MTILDHGNQITWIHEPDDKYVVTGVTRDGRRFKKTFDSWQWAAGINLYRGTRWLLRGGKRKLLQTVWN